MIDLKKVYAWINCKLNCEDNKASCVECQDLYGVNVCSAAKLDYENEIKKLLEILKGSINFDEKYGLSPKISEAMFIELLEADFGL